MEELEQGLPYNLEAERSVLGSMLLEHEALEQMLEQLKADDFYLSSHEDIFAAMRDIRNSGSAVDLVTLSNELEKHGKLDAAGGMVYLTELMSFVPTAANVQHYAKIVEERSVQRALIRAGHEMINDGSDDEKNVEDSLDKAERRIYDISMRKTEDSLVSISVIVPNALNEIGELMARKGKITGVATGFRDLDRMTNGFQKSDLIIIAGRPAMGKSALAMNIAQYAAIHDNRSVVVFSLEMSREQLVTRMLCTEASVDSQRIKEGLLTDQETMRLIDSSGPMQNSKLHIDDSGGVTVSQIRSKCRRLKARLGLDMIIIDYMQLMQGVGGGSRKNDNRQQEISDMTRALKLLARELNVPILLLSQLNRGPEQRQDHRPMISDLRESGSIEQDADMVILLYREQVYDETADNTSEIIIAKHRHGPIGTVKVAWQGEFTRFMTLANP
ncbi:MAG: replicative DNA helicase [Eubacteriales bacterium]|nr:replicative DNA helicase [Eubacteriales bacterium]